MVDCVGNGGGDAGEADLSHAAGAQGVEDRVGVVEEGDVDRGGVRIGGDDVVGEVVIDGSTGPRVVAGGLEQGHADAHDNGTFDLIAGWFRVENPAAIDHANNPRDTQAGGLGLPGDFCELRAKGVG